VLAVAYVGGLPFRALVLVFAALAVREWVRLVEPEQPSPWVGVSLAAVAGLQLIDMLLGPGTMALASMLGGVALGLAAAKAGSRHAGLVGFGIPYIAIGSGALMWVRDEPAIGFGLCWFLLLSVWATDVGGYAVGRTVGGPKLWPRVSPKKTWSGLLGGMAGAALFGAGTAAVFDGRIGIAAAVAAVLAVIAQGGDLFESAVKRHFDVKDSGNLIPGHGGLLDRVDGLLAAGPALFVFHVLFGRWLGWW